MLVWIRLLILMLVGRCVVRWWVMCCIRFECWVMILLVVECWIFLYWVVFFMLLFCVV